MCAGLCVSMIALTSNNLSSMQLLILYIVDTQVPDKDKRTRHTLNVRRVHMKHEPFFYESA